MARARRRRGRSAAGGGPGDGAGAHAGWHGARRTPPVASDSPRRSATVPRSARAPVTPRPGVDPPNGVIRRQAAGWQRAFAGSSRQPGLVGREANGAVAEPVAQGAEGFADVGSDRAARRGARSSAHREQNRRRGPPGSFEVGAGADPAGMPSATTICALTSPRLAPGPGSRMTSGAYSRRATRRLRAKSYVEVGCSTSVRRASSAGSVE